MKALFISSLIIFAFGSAQADQKEVTVIEANGKVERLAGSKCTARAIDKNVQILVKHGDEMATPYKVSTVKLFKPETAVMILEAMANDGCEVDATAAEELIEKGPVAVIEKAE